MSYIDCYLAPIPINNKAAYEALARISQQVLQEYGASRVVECWLDNAGPDASSYHGSDVQHASHHYASFVQVAGARENETVVMSFVEWPDKATRDSGMQKVTRDPRMQFAGQPSAFDGSRLIAAGFLPML